MNLFYKGRILGVRVYSCLFCMQRSISLLVIPRFKSGDYFECALFSKYSTRILTLGSTLAMDSFICPT